MQIQKFFSIILLFIYSIIFSSCQNSSNTIVQKSNDLREIIEIAVLMPVTGRDSVVGNQYNHLIKLGLHDALKSHINVTSYDGSDAKQIIASMDKIVARKTKIILGPLYSELTNLISSKAKAHNIIVITMSNNPVLADDGLFVFGHAPLKQLERILNYFLDNDYKHFIALLPNSPHSETVNNIIQNIVVQKNASLVRSEFYLPLPESINKYVKLISDKVDDLNEMDDILTKPIIYLNDDPKNLNLIFNAIDKYNLDKKAIIIGDNKIDIDYPSHINLIFTGSLNILNSDVVKRAKDFGINHLSFMHLLAYDLGRLTASYINNEFVLEQFLARLNSKEPYVGLSGTMYFVDSIVQRKYDIIKKDEEIYTTLQFAE